MATGITTRKFIYANLLQNELRLVNTLRSDRDTSKNELIHQMTHTSYLSAGFELRLVHLEYAE